MSQEPAAKLVSTVYTARPPGVFAKTPAADRGFTDSRLSSDPSVGPRADPRAASVENSLQLAGSLIRFLARTVDDAPRRPRGSGDASISARMALGIPVTPAIAGSRC